MRARTLKQPRVEFFATSNRLANAYKRAAKKNRSLAARASFHQLGRGTMAVRANGDAGESPSVILSHADDNPDALTGKGMASMTSRAFHLLFTEPDTHPDQIAQWMRRANIRSENRLHVVRVESLDAPHISDLLGRVCSALGADGDRGSIIDAYLAGDELLVRGPRQRVLHVPIGLHPSLRDQPRALLQNFQIDPDGSFLYWPDLDVQLSWHHFLQAVDPVELRKAQQRSADFNRRYGAAIRALREKAGIRQDRVTGLTDRQMRRIEQGQCRATTSALHALAKAHGLDVNAYLTELGKALA